jgi:hypothetical protein
VRSFRDIVGEFWANVKKMDFALLAATSALSIISILTLIGGYETFGVKRIVMQTLRGATDILAAEGRHPEAEIDRVTTPGGLTIKGLNAMEAAGFTHSVIEGLRASTKR